MTREHIEYHRRQVQRMQAGCVSQVAVIPHRPTHTLAETGRLLLRHYSDTWKQRHHHHIIPNNGKPNTNPNPYRQWSKLFKLNSLMLATFTSDLFTFVNNLFVHVLYCLFTPRDRRTTDRRHTHVYMCFWCPACIAAMTRSNSARLMCSTHVNKKSS